MIDLGKKSWVGIRLGQAIAWRILHVCACFGDQGAAFSFRILCSAAAVAAALSACGTSTPRARPPGAPLQGESVIWRARMGQVCPSGLAPAPLRVLRSHPREGPVLCDGPARRGTREGAKK